MCINTFSYETGKYRGDDYACCNIVLFVFGQQQRYAQHEGYWRYHYNIGK